MRWFVTPVVILCSEAKEDVDNPGGASSWYAERMSRSAVRKSRAMSNLARMHSRHVVVPAYGVFFLCLSEVKPLTEYLEGFYYSSSTVIHRRCHDARVAIAVPTLRATRPSIKNNAVELMSCTAGSPWGTRKLDQPTSHQPRCHHRGVQNPNTLYLEVLFLLFNGDP